MTVPPSDDIISPDAKWLFTIQTPWLQLRCEQHQAWSRRDLQHFKPRKVIISSKSIPDPLGFIYSQLSYPDQATLGHNTAAASPPSVAPSTARVDPVCDGSVELWNESVSCPFWTWNLLPPPPACRPRPRPCTPA